MADAVKEFFANLESRADSSKTAGMSELLRLRHRGRRPVEGRRRRRQVTVTEGGGDADATISASEETFEKIVAGELNPTSAYMTGKLKIKGDMGARHEVPEALLERVSADLARTLRHSSSSTSSAPPATRSPSATCTARTVASYGDDERRLHLHRLEDDERLARATRGRRLRRAP